MCSLGVMLGSEIWACWKNRGHIPLHAIAEISLYVIKVVPSTWFHFCLLWAAQVEGKLSFNNVSVSSIRSQDLNVLELEWDPHLDLKDPWIWTLNCFHLSVVLISQLSYLLLDLLYSWLHLHINAVVFY